MTETEAYEVHATVQGEDEYIGTFDGIAARDDGMALFRDGSPAGFIHYDRSPVATPTADAEVTDAVNDADTEGAV